MIMDGIVLKAIFSGYHCAVNFRLGFSTGPFIRGLSKRTLTRSGSYGYLAGDFS